MSETAISITGLGKAYRLGSLGRRHATLRESLASSFGAPLRKLRGALRGQSAREAGETLWALRDISLDVPEGEVLAVIGRNGAGKTTLLRILAGITDPSEGRAVLRGRVASLLEVGTGFHPDLTGRENVFLNGAMLGMSRSEIRSRFDEIVAFAEIERFLDTQVKHYSSGMYLRLAFSVAAHLEPEILLVDEVLAVGDAAFQRRCLGKMNAVAVSGRTVLFVSHNMEAVQRLCDRGVYLENGRCVQDGPVGEVVSEYLRRVAPLARASYRAQSASLDRGEEALLLSADLLDERGCPSRHVRAGERFSISMSWLTREGSSGLAYFVRLFDNQGRLLFGLNHPVSSRGGRRAQAVRVVVENVLAPGEYRLTLGAWRKPKTLVHVVEDCLSFSVLATESGREDSASPQSIFVPCVEWQIQDAEDEQLQA